MDLVHQFYNPGKATNPVADAKADHKASPNLKPLFTRKEVFSRLNERFTSIVSLADQVAFEQHIDALKLKKSPSSFEQVILGLAFWFGQGAIEDRDAAFTQFELASADATNGYADALLGRAYFLVGKKARIKFLQTTDPKKALECLEKAVIKSLEVEGYVSSIKGDMHHRKNETGLALACYKKGAELGDSLGLGRYNFFCKDEDEQIKCLHANMSAPPLVAFVNYATTILFSGEETRPTAVRWLVLAAKLGAQGAVYNAGICFKGGTGVQKDVERAAWYFRCCFLSKAWSSLAKEKLCDLLQKNSGNVAIAYHYAMVFDRSNSTLHDLFSSHSETFMRLWLQDYSEPLHAEMKAQAIKVAFNNAGILNYLSDKNPGIFERLWIRDYDKYLDIKAPAMKYVSTLDPEKLSAATCHMLATVFGNCSEKAVKDKARAFSLAAVDKAKKEEAAATERLAKERDAKGGVAKYTVAATGGNATVHSINGATAGGKMVA